jgi:hypothetical protein
MQYLTGTVAVVNGSAAVVGTGTSWTAALAGGVFKVGGVAGEHIVQSVESATAMTLATVWTGGTDSELGYQIVQDFTDNYGFREIHAGDREWAWHLTQTIRAIDAAMAAVDPNSGGVTTITFADSPYTVQSDDAVLRIDCTDGDVVVQFPPSAEAGGRRIRAKKIGTDNNAAKYTPAAAETVEGEAVSYDSTMPGEFMEFCPVGATGWERIG